MSPAELLLKADDRLWSGPKGWPFAVGLLAERLGMRREDAAAAMAAVNTRQRWTFGRVTQSAHDPRRFDLVETGGGVALLVPTFPEEPSGFDGFGDALAGDVIALSLTGGRFWRRTLLCDGLGLDDDAIRDGTLRLYQDAHGYIRQVLLARGVESRAWTESIAAKETALARLVEPIKAIAPLDGRGELTHGHACWPQYCEALKKVWAIGEEASARVRRLYPVAAQRGALILDPGQFDWTRRGALKDVEAIEILDAPATGPLGRALRKLNPLIGSPRGVDLVGVVSTNQQKRAA